MTATWSSFAGHPERVSLEINRLFASILARTVALQLFQHVVQLSLAFPLVVHHGGSSNLFGRGRGNLHLFAVRQNDDGGPSHKRFDVRQAVD